MNRKKIILSIFKIMIFMILFMGIPSNKVVKGEVSIHILAEDGSPKIGGQLSVKIAGIQENKKYVYRWKADGEERSSEKEYLLTVADCEKWIELEVYEETDEESHTLQLLGKDQFYFSKLPVVYIQTDDGASITQEGDYKPASMTIQGNQEYGTQYSESDRIQIKLRGNSSSKFPQKPYKIKLEKKSNLFGMGKNKHWVLLSNFLDECCMRNVIASALAKQIGVEAMDMRWVTVVFNGKYSGTYILAEHIRIGKDRIDTKDWEEIAEDAAEDIYKANKENLEPEDQENLEDYMKEHLSWITTGEITYNSVKYSVSDDYSDYEKNCKNISGGYIFELSREYDEVSRFRVNSGMPVMINSPEYLITNTEMFNYVKNYWNAFDAAACSTNNQDANGQSLYEMADIDSMVAYWLVMEIMGNNDAFEKSRFAYKDVDGKLVFGPVWDFDWGSAARSICEVGDDVSEGWIISQGPLWKDWVDDPYFLAKAREKYWEVHEYLEELVREHGIIENNYQYIRESGNALFHYIVKSGWGNYSKVCGRPSRGFEDDYSMFYQFMKNRIAWLDLQFADMETLTNSLSEIGSHPLVKLDDVQILVDDHPAEPDMVVTKTNEVFIKVNDTKNQMDYLELCVNGEKIGTYPVTDGKCLVSCPADCFNQDTEAENMVVLLGYQEENLVMNDYLMVSFKEPETVTTTEEMTSRMDHETETGHPGETFSVTQETSISQKTGKSVLKREIKIPKKAVIKKCRKKRCLLIVKIRKEKVAKGYTIYGYKTKKSAKHKKKAVLIQSLKGCKVRQPLKGTLAKKVKFVRVRAFNKDFGGKKVYGRWSKIVKVK